MMYDHRFHVSDSVNATRHVAYDWYGGEDIDLSTGVHSFGGNTAAELNGVVLRMTNRSTATLSEAKLPSWDNMGHRYSALFDALCQMKDADEDDSIWIDMPTYREACGVLALLSYRKIEAPKIFSHGGDAVVFNWPKGDISYQLTVSGGVASLGRRTRGEGAKLIGHANLAEGGVAELFPGLRGNSAQSGSNYF